MNLDSIRRSDVDRNAVDARPTIYLMGAKVFCAHFTLQESLLRSSSIDLDTDFVELDMRAPAAAKEKLDSGPLLLRILVPKL